MHVMEIDDDFCIICQLESFLRYFYDDGAQASFRRYHVPTMELPYFPWLLYELAKRQHVLAMLVLFRAII